MGATRKDSVDYFQAIALGLIQGVTELFPVSSLGHSVILPKLLGWDDVVAAQSAKESYFLAFLVGLHVATALALLTFYARLGPDHPRRPRLAPDAANRDGRRAARLAAHRGHDPRRAHRRALRARLPNDLRQAAAGRRVPLRQRPDPARGRVVSAAGRSALGRVAHGLNAEGARRLDTLEFREAGVVGVAQLFALLAGISRSGITMVAGLVRGLDHEDAARFSFMLATPIILAAGVYKLPDLLGPNGDGVLGQVLAGSVAAAIAAYVSVRFLTRYFTTRTLMPFAIYCLVAGALAAVRFAA